MSSIEFSLNYRREKNIVDNYDEFEECLIDFTSKLYECIFSSLNIQLNILPQ